jgi:hypothetical protein
MASLVQITNAGCFIRSGQWPPDTFARSDLGPIRRQREIRIRSKKRRDLLRLLLVDSNLPRSQRRIVLLEALPHLFPRQGSWRLGRRANGE